MIKRSQYFPIRFYYLKPWKVFNQYLKFREKKKQFKRKYNLLICYNGLNSMNVASDTFKTNKMIVFLIQMNVFYL